MKTYDDYVLEGMNYAQKNAEERKLWNNKDCDRYIFTQIIERLEHIEKAIELDRI